MLINTMSRHYDCDFVNVCRSDWMRVGVSVSNIICLSDVCKCGKKYENMLLCMCVSGVHEHDVRS